MDGRSVHQAGKGWIEKGRKRSPRPSQSATRPVLGYHTTLDISDIPLIEFYIGCGVSLSETARRMGTTRDKVRTVREHATA